MIGHFAFGFEFFDGQTVKTQIVTEELENQLGKDQVLKLDTHGGWKVLLKSPFQVFRALKNSTNVLIFPAHNGLKVYAPLLWLEKMFFKSRKIHYIVIGGWLSNFLSKRKILSAILRKFDGIYVETSTMKKALEGQGFNNVIIVPNCKKLSVISEAAVSSWSHPPYKLCTFSRVMKEKGIDDIVNAVININNSCNETIYSLDIFGPIDESQTEWFEILQQKFPEYICYKGVVPFAKSVETVKNYFALVFPTRFYTEGVPGTIIDAYAAGVPVISSKWESFNDIVDEGKTGIGYTFADAGALEDVLTKVYKNLACILDMKRNCIEKSMEFLPSTVIGRFIKYLG